mmetsp:Transcript_15969/g.28645  ORF Transcript_15969/g.28645 Transcript_15969/m.28645 type:complete len:159 (-) Transcript_15969:236-712(-)|eukprot:CAMPEP_0197516932 /NCGR_PEP_ID=MMETSP1318-20131121/1886_1 /TAXON_ID=552666 /ORGANISM="Partenskyella glossopodia, Strain RCC365" /LENGTH=158 /DNA_ID=CAMNT_0043066085 /DNA_START=68 /DNA_END=544 /DNA_ORIENTATION=-
MSSSKSAIKLLSDYKKLEEAENFGEDFEVSDPRDDGNVYKWEVIIFVAEGEGSPYEDGSFFLEIEFPESYPEHPPKSVRMKTKIYHPNITLEGKICMGDLKSNWRSNMSAKTVIDQVVSIVKNPDPEDAINSAVAKIMKEDKEKFTKTAKEWTEKYAQ